MERVLSTTKKRCALGRGSLDRSRRALPYLKVSLTVSDLQQTFKQFDKNGDGTISKDELRVGNHKKFRLQRAVRRSGAQSKLAKSYFDS